MKKSLLTICAVNMLYYDKLISLNLLSIMN